MLGWGVLHSVSGQTFAQPIYSRPLEHGFKASQALATPSEVSDRLSIDCTEPPNKVVQGYRDPKAGIAFLDSFDAELGLSAEMKSEKRALMAESAHAFYRATPALFYHDLKSSFEAASQLLPELAPKVAIVGDAHLLNAGTFRGPEGKPVWGLNDFDQADIGSPEWDLERMGVSLYLAGRSGGMSRDESLQLVREMGESYLSSLGEKKPAYLTEHEAEGKIEELIDKAGRKTEKKLLAKWTTSDGQHLLRDDKLVEVASKRKAQLQEVLAHRFPNLKVLDLASKPHSGGSTRGLERYYCLVESSERSSPWLLEIKEVLPSPVQTADGDLSRGDGDAILGFQKLMGSPVDSRHQAFKIDGLAFFTREREPEKAALKDSPKDIKEAAAPLGKLLARAHSASRADLKGWIAGRGEQLLDKLQSFSQIYARQVESDYRELSQNATSDSTATPERLVQKHGWQPPAEANGFIISY